MHYSQSHQYDSSDPDVGTDNTTPQADLGGLGPYEYLLRDSDSELCKSCHNDQMFAPDVFGGNTGIAYERQAGGLTDPDSSGYDSWNGHTLNAKIHDAPGLPDCLKCHFGTPMPGVDLSCIHCHDPHGNVPINTKDVANSNVISQFRNLRVDGSTTGLVGISYAKGTNDEDKDVLLRHYYDDGHPGETVGDRYNVSVMDLNEPVPNRSAIGRFCAVCHGIFHGSSIDSNMKLTGGWVRHPTADADISAISGPPYLPYSGIDYKVKVMDPGGDWESAPDGDETPTCTTCHRAHGSTRPFGLIYAKGDAALGENGDGTQLRDLCKQCHVQGD